MLSQQKELRGLLSQLADGVLLGLALWGGHNLRFRAPDLMGWDIPRIGSFEGFVPLLVFEVILGPLFLESCSIYRRTILDKPGAFFFCLGQAILLLLLMCGLLIFMFRMDNLARGVVILFAAFGFVLITLRHFFLGNILNFFFQGKNLPSGILLVGSPEHLAVLKKQIRLQTEMHLAIVGEVSILENLETSVADWLGRAPISAVIFRVPHAGFEGIQKAVTICELQGVEAWLLSDALRPRLATASFETVFGHPTILFVAKRPSLWQSLAKRLLDIVVSFLGLLVTLPLLGFVAIAIRIESRGPIFFIQDRSGLRGRVFRMFKLRSMISNADMLRSELVAFNEMDGPVFKIGKDPRVTRVGAFLRHTSIDELPQLWNVLKGEMSLVGPRPLPVYETQQISKLHHRRRLSVKPGLVCLWQISGRNRIHSFDEWARLDLEYVDNWSFWLDLKILLKTIPVVLTGVGAR